MGRCRFAAAGSRRSFLSISACTGQNSSYAAAPLMLSTLALIALIAEPNAARHLTTTTEVMQALEPAARRWQPGAPVRLQWQPFGFDGSSTEAFLDLSSGVDPSGTRTARARLGLDGLFSLGRFASALSSSFARWSVSVGFDVQSAGAAPELPVAASDQGLLVAHVGHGLYLGHPPAVRAELFPYREYVRAQPSLSYAGVQLGMDGTLFLTRHLGLRFDVSAGSAMYGGISLIYQPGR
jgi:hypothetical protein